ncbi:hypothetical protein JHK85_017033 [Glycine max]|nr:hypothetical protein JHK85_017033 [Glycine max]
MALCESDRKMQILDVVKNIDVTKLSSAKSIADIFQSLGRLHLESIADDLLLDLRACDHDADNISNFIVSYAVSIPNLAVEDIIPKFKNMHELLEVLPSTSSYEKLILHCCGLDKTSQTKEGSRRWAAVPPSQGGSDEHRTADDKAGMNGDASSSSETRSIHHAPDKFQNGKVPTSSGQNTNFEPKDNNSAYRV